MMAVGILIVGLGIAYPLFMGDFNLYTRNFSLNKSNNSLRSSLQKLKSDIDMSIEPPWLVNYSVSGSTGVLTPQASTVTSAQGILLWVNLGQAFDMIPTAGPNTGGTVTPSTGIKVRYAASAATTLTAMPQIGDRLIIMSPAPYTAGMFETVTMNGATIQKPGRKLTSVTKNGDGTLTLGLDLTNPLPAGILGDQTVYVVREVAYVANTLLSGTTPVERQLVRYATTAAMNVPDVLIRDLDPDPQETDSNTGATIQPFNYYGKRGTLSPLNVCLPIRALDFARSLAERNLGGAQPGTSATEFNVYLRSNTQLGIRARLD